MNILYLLLYTIANIFVLLNYNGLYWDDWVAYNQDSQTMAIFFDMIRHNIKGDFYLIVEKFFNHIYGFRLFIYFAYLFIGYFIYRIILSTELFNDHTSKFIAFLSVLVPINSVKIYISIAPFVFPMLLFYLAFFLLARNYPLPNKSLKVIILTVFFFSFSTNSILVFYASVLFYLYYMDNNKSIKINLKTITSFILNRWDFIVLPIFYFLYKSIYLVPYGLYNNYNKVSFSFEKITNILQKTLEFMTKDLFISLLENNYVVIAAVIVSGLIALLVKHNIKIGWKKSLLLFIFSIILFILAVFPYAAVNKTPTLMGTNGRLALLLGPAIAMFFIAVISLLSNLFLRYKQKAFLFLASFLVITMTAKNIPPQYELILDNFYQAAIIENFKENNSIKNHTTFLVHPCKACRKRGFYEWSGILKKTFGNTTRLMFLPRSIKRLNQKGTTKNGKSIFFFHQFKHYKQYNFYQWDGNQNYKEVYIKKDMNLTPLLQAKLMFYYLFNDDKFKKLAKLLVVISVK